MGLFSALGSIVGSVVPGVGTMIGGAIGSAIDGAQASNTASQASDAQMAAMAEQARLYGVQADMGEYFLNQYQDQYAPLAQSQLQAAQAGLDPQYYANQADASVVSNYGQAIDMAGRNMARAGVSPQDGQWLAMQQSGALDMTGQRVAAQNQARQFANDANWNRRNQMLDYGSGLVQRGSQLAGNAASGFGNSATGYGTQAGLAGNAAGTSWNQAANGFVDWWNGSSNNPPGGMGAGGFGGMQALPGFGQSSTGGFGGYSSVPSGQSWFS